MDGTDYKYIIFFDGDCGLCDRVMYYLLRRKELDHFYFAPLQGQFAAKFLGVDYSLSDKEMKSVVVMTPQGQYQKSQAFFAIIEQMSFPMNLLKIFKVVPRYIADKIYDVIASIRKKLFAQKNYCAQLVPMEQYKKRLIP